MMLFRSPAIDRTLGLLFIVMLTIGAGNTALQSIMPALGRSLAINDHYVAAAFSVSAFAWMFAAPFWAKQSDRAGLKPLVMIGVFGFIASLTLCAFSLTAGVWGLIGPTATILCFIGARVVYGLFGAAAPPAAQAIVAGESSREDRTRALTLLASAFGLGTILGPAVAPLFVLPYVGLAGPAYAFAFFALLVVFAVWRGLPAEASRRRGRGAMSSYPSIAGAPTGASIRVATARSDDEDLPPIVPQRARLPVFDARVWPWLLVGILLGHGQVIGGQAIGFLVIDRLHLEPMAAQHAITIVLMSGASAALLVQWGLIPMLNLSPRSLIIWGSLVAAAGCFATAWSFSLYAITVSFAVTSAGFGFVRPGYTAGASLAVGPAEQATVAGRVTSVNGSAFVLGPTIGVSLFQGGQDWPYLVSGLLCLATLGYSLWRSRSDA